MAEADLHGEPARTPTSARHEASTAETFADPSTRSAPSDVVDGARKPASVAAVSVEVRGVGEVSAEGTVGG